VDLWPENQIALDIYQMIQAMGPEITLQFLDLEFNQREAEDLMYKLLSINQIIRQIQEEEQKNADH
jgi:hypothetical protein